MKAGRLLCHYLSLSLAIYNCKFNFEKRIIRLIPRDSTRSNNCSGPLPERWDIFIFFLLHISPFFMGSSQLIVCCAFHLPQLVRLLMEVIRHPLAPIWSCADKKKIIKKITASMLRHSLDLYFSHPRGIRYFISPLCLYT